MTEHNSEQRPTLRAGNVESAPVHVVPYRGDCASSNTVIRNPAPDAAPAAAPSSQIYGTYRISR
jgi:hypothetical protein